MTEEAKPQHTVNDLYAVLFSTIKGVRDGSVPIESAQAINDLSQTIVNAAKVQVEFSKVTGNDVAGGFLPAPAPQPATTTPEPGVTRHQLR